jgi:hypothetical protein
VADDAANDAEESSAVAQTMLLLKSCMTPMSVL